ncbi:putative amidoligase enzyme-domain-containing protein [Nemania diffusa]|nr:putative amidoligase enzyme-domain-containing protein [Nemania diffusa]
MSTSTLTNPELPTFGVEVEFLIAAVPPGIFRDPHRHIKGLPPVLRLPDFTSNYANFETREYFTIRRVKEVLDEHFGTPSPLSLLPKYQTWRVTNDSSISEMGGSPYILIPIEINSPVYYASPDGFDAVKTAIALITSKFRCTVNSSCGVHVHVGMGLERLSLDQVRRMASLCYAVEPLLFTLHHPVRRVNKYCKPLREHSYLSQVEEGHMLPHHKNNSRFKFREGSECYQYIGRDRRHGEYPISRREETLDPALMNGFLTTRKPGHFEPFISPDDSTHAETFLDNISHQLDLRISATEPSTTAPGERPRKRNIPRLRTPPLTPEEIAELQDMLPVGEGYENSPPAAADPGTSVFEATQRIYSQPASCYISKQMHSGSLFERLAINFQAYSCDNLVFSKRTMRTIEFRFGEGSLDGDWISTWAKICAGILSFALYSSPRDFINVLTNCDKASREEGVYDIIDLLDDIGLFAEAEKAEQRLMANKDEWQLKFVSS